MDAELLQQLRYARTGLIRSQGRLRAIFLLSDEHSDIEDMNIKTQIFILKDAIASIETILVKHGIN